MGQARLARAKSHHVHVGGRGGAYMQVEMKDIEAGTNLNQRFRTDDKVERAFVDARDMQNLYQRRQRLRVHGQGNLRAA